MKPYQKLADRYAALLAELGLKCADYPVSFSAEPGAVTCVELIPEGFRLYSTSRGAILGTTVFSDEDSLFYRLMHEIIRQEGLKHCRTFLPPGDDPRRLEFDRRLALTGQLSPVWQLRLKRELAEVLQLQPYRPIPGLTAKTALPDTRPGPALDLQDYPGNMPGRNARVAQYRPASLPSGSLSIAADNSGNIAFYLITAMALLWILADL